MGVKDSANPASSKKLLEIPMRGGVFGLGNLGGGGWYSREEEGVKTSCHPLGGVGFFFWNNPLLISKLANTQFTQRKTRVKRHQENSKTQ